MTQEQMTALRHSIRKELNKLSDLRVMVVADLCLDYYGIGGNVGWSREVETHPVFGVHDYELSPGGGGNLIQNLLALGVEVVAVGDTGKDMYGRELYKILGDMGCDMRYVTQYRRKAPVFHKFHHPKGELEGRYDIISDPPSDFLIRHMVRTIELESDRCDAILAADYNEFGTGIVVGEVADSVSRIASCPTFATSRNNVGRFDGVTYMIMNRKELAQVFGTLTSGDIYKDACSLAKACRSRVLVTLADAGSALYSAECLEHRQFGVKVDDPVDPCGCGDTLMSVFSVMIAAEIPEQDAMKYADAAARVVLKKINTTGTATLGEIYALLCSDVQHQKLVDDGSVTEEEV